MSDEHLAVQTEDQVMDEIICPVRGAFRPCDPALLRPLLGHLESNQTVTEPIEFPRGTMLPDGRLDLCKQEIGPRGAALVAASLPHNSQVRHLLLGANGIGDEGVSAIAEAVASHAILETVYLGCNLITSKGATAIADAVAGNSAVRALWIKRNPIGMDGARAVAEAMVANGNLRCVDLVHTEIGSSGLRMILEAACDSRSGVERLYLSGNRLSPDDAAHIAELLVDHPRLKHLFLGVNRLADAGARWIAEGIRRNQRLETLALSSNDLGCEGVDALADSLQNHPSLSSLDLGFDRSTNVLGEGPNRIGDRGAAAIARLLGANPRLRSLDLASNLITESGIRPLLDALEFHTGITSIELGHPLTTESRNRIREVIARNRCRLGWSPSYPPDLAAILSVYRTVPSEPTATQTG